MIGSGGKDKRLHFGVLLSSIDYSIQCEIWDGIVEYAKVGDIHLTAHVGDYHTIREGDDYIQHFGTCLENIGNSKSLDGLIIIARATIDIWGPDNFKMHFNKVPDHLPVVLDVRIIPGIPSVYADSIGGIYSVVDHLIKVHGKSKIAFIKGPEEHPETEDRLTGYKKALEANGIAFDERYVLPGKFNEKAGHLAVEELIDRRKLTFDAVAASSDDIARGVLKELKSRNILVPKDVAVTGFDDERDSATFIPSISTARQDLFRIGAVAAETLHNMIDGKAVEETTYIAPLFIARQSCGCTGQTLFDAEFKYDYAAVREDSLFSFVLREFTHLFSPDVPQKQIREWVGSLVGTFKEEPFTEDNFIKLFDEILLEYNHYSDKVVVWHEALSVLTVGVELHQDEFENNHLILSALFNAATFIHDNRLREMKIKDLALRNIRLHLRKVTSAFALIFDVNSLAEYLCKSLPELSIDTALIGVYRNPFKSHEQSADRTIETLVGFDGERKFNLEHNKAKPIVFSDHSTIDGFDFGRERRTVFFLPLFFEDEELGAMLLPYNDKIPMDVYDTLRINISIALKGAQLISKIQTLSITDELTGLFNRRGFFRFAYQKMRQLERLPDRMPMFLFMDMDGLKFINDNYGHKEGDTALAAFADILRSTVRGEDIIGRMGGDEFAVFSSVKSRKNGEQLVIRLRAKLDEYNSKGFHPYKVSVSIGTVFLVDTKKESLDAAMHEADGVLYEEKMRKKKEGLSRC